MPRLQALESPYYRDAVSQVGAARAHMRARAESSSQPRNRFPTGTITVDEPAEEPAVPEDDPEMIEGEVLDQGQPPGQPAAQAPGRGTPGDGSVFNIPQDFEREAGLPSRMMDFEDWQITNYPDLARQPRLSKKVGQMLRDQYGFYAATHTAAEQSAMRRADVMSRVAQARASAAGRGGVSGRGTKTESPTASLERKAAAELEAGKTDGPAFKAYRSMKSPGKDAEVGSEFRTLFSGEAGMRPSWAVTRAKDPVKGFLELQGELENRWDTFNEKEQRAASLAMQRLAPDPQLTLQSGEPPLVKAKILATTLPIPKVREAALYAHQEGWIDQAEKDEIVKTTLTEEERRQLVESRQRGKGSTIGGPGATPIDPVEAQLQGMRGSRRAIVEERKAKAAGAEGERVKRETTARQEKELRRRAFPEILATQNVKAVAPDAPVNIVRPDGSVVTMARRLLTPEMVKDLVSRGFVIPGQDELELEP